MVKCLPNVSVQIFAQCGCSNVHVMWMFKCSPNVGVQMFTQCSGDCGHQLARELIPTWLSGQPSPRLPHINTVNMNIIIFNSGSKKFLCLEILLWYRPWQVSSQEVSEWWASLAKPVACQGFPFPIFLYHTLSCVSLRIIQRENQFKFSSSPTGWPRESLKARLLEVGGWPGIYRANPGLSLPPSQDETPQHCHRDTKSF